MASAGLPAHKLIPQTGFIVDGFKYRSPSIKAYFLSHAHSDHYTGLRETWDYGPIYCSEVTGRLIVRIAGVSPELIRPLPWDTPTDVDGVEVTLVDANHCPGAAQLLFKLPSGELYVHCGDMRFGQHLLGNPHLQRFQNCNAVFLDTTYCNPKYTFPPQADAVEYIASTVHRLITKDDGKRRLFLIQTYVIGKEHILIEVFKRCQRKIHLSERKLGIMQCLEMPGLVTDELFTIDPDETNIHLTQWGWLGESWPFFRPNFKNMEIARKEMRVDEVIGFCPTGWMYEMKKQTYPVKSKGPNSIHLVPYSEHSSYNELREYVRFLKPHKVIPTVNVEGEDADKNRRAMLKHFRNLVDETASKASFLAAFKRGGSGGIKPASTASSEISEVGEEDDEAEPPAGRDCDEPSEASGREPSGNLALEDDVPVLADEIMLDAAESGQPAAEEPCAAGNENAVRNTQSSGLSALPTPEGSSAAGSQLELSLRPWAQKPGQLDESGHQDDQPGTSDPALPKSSKAQLATPGFGPQLTNAEDLEGGVAKLTKIEDSKGTAISTKAEDPESGASRPSGLEEYSEQQDQLIAILGAEVSRGAAVKLLQQSRGDIQRAVNAFYDKSASQQPPKFLAKKTNPSKPQPTQKEKGVKRKAASKAASATPKKSKLSSDQRQITAFFSQNGNAAPPKVRGRAGGSPSRPIILEDEEEEPQISSQEEDAKDLSREPAMPPPSASREHDAAATKEGLDRKRQKLKLPPAPKPVRKSKSPSPEAAAVVAEPPGGNKATAEPPDPAAQMASESSAGRASVGDGRGASPPAAVPVDRSKEVPWDAVLKSVKEYNPIGLAIWGERQPAPYLHISRALAAMDSTTKRLRISDVIANMFRSLLALSPDAILPAAYLVTGKLAPDYEGVEMSVGGSIISAAVIEATGVTKQRLSALYKKHGDLGDVVQACRHNQATLQKPAPLTVAGVYKTMRQIAAEKGNGSSARKQRAVLSLLRGAREEEPKYLVRTLISNLRVGANWRSVIPGLARAFVLHEKGSGATKAEMDAASAKVSEAFHLCPSLDVLIPALRAGGLEELERRCTLRAGVPLKPMLAKICEGIPDALRQLPGGFLAEFKYDGMRCQIHLLPDGSVRMFSRNCEDRTAAYPDVVEIIQQAAAGGASQLVMDAELVAVDRSDNNRLRAFQELSTRARGRTELHQVSVHVCVFVFDLLMVDGEALLKQSLRHRRERVPAALPNFRPGFIQMAESREFGAQSCGAAASAQASRPANADGMEAPKEEILQDMVEVEEGETPSLEADVQTYLLESFASGTEGLMLKALDVHATYQASKRSENWIKLKRDYCEGLRDSLDLVPIGAWYGQGRKTGWFSPFLLAAWDPEKEEFQSVCRCMSGFTDAFYTEATARLTETICERKAYYNTGEWPSVWFEPGEVWEIRGADLTISPVHRAAIGCIEANRDRGVSLRFPRYIRTREDKSTEDASSPDVLVDLYNKQTRKMSSAKELLEAQKKSESAEEAALQGGAEERSDSEDEAGGSGIQIATADHLDPQSVTS